MRRIIRLLVLLLVAVAVGVYWYQNVYTATSNATNNGALRTSGTIEARPVAVVAEVGGQVIELKAREGDVVAQGAVLAQLDTALLDTQIARAQAAVDAANAGLAQIKAGARDEQIRQAQASLDKASAARDGAQQALKDIQALRDTPQDIDAQLTQARGQLQAAEATIPLAETQLRTAKVVRDRYQNSSDPQDKVQFDIAAGQVRAAEAGLKAAQISRDGAQTLLDLLAQLRAQPLPLVAQVHAAEGRLAQAEATVAIAQANLDALKAGATKEQLDIANAQVQQAQAALEQLQAQREKMTLRAPIAGIVTVSTVRLGENVQPGTKLLTLANLDAVQFTLYVPETRIGQVRLGQSVRLLVDGAPNRTFEAQVYFISPNAEFTPTTVQTKDERAKTVFMVKARIQNTDHTLKPGMPADAIVE